MDDYTAVIMVESPLLLRPETAGKVLALLSEAVPVMYDFDACRWKFCTSVGYSSVARVQGLTPSAHAALMCSEPNQPNKA